MWCKCSGRGLWRRLRIFCVLLLLCVVIICILERVNIRLSKVIPNKTGTANMTLPGWKYIMIAGDTSPADRTKQGASCHVPNLSLNTDTNMAYFQPLSSLTCQNYNNTRLFHINDSVVILRGSVPEKSHTIEYCDYRAIGRISDNVFAYSKRIRRNDNFEVRVQNDFLLVECVTSSNLPGVKGHTALVKKNSHTYQNIMLDPKHDYNLRNSIFHTWTDDDLSMGKREPDSHQFFAQVYPQKTVLDRISRTKPFPHSTQLNVLLLSLDSMSHLNYQRTMPLTYKYLKQSLGSVILNSYNIVGDATLAAFIPLLTGHTESELPNIRPGLFTEYADSYPFIWQKYTQSGYVTLYGEDRSDIETFQMSTNGFKQKPVDHYMRAFWQAVFDSNSDYRKKPWFHCLDGIPRHKYMLDYVKDFFEKYPDVPKFAFQHMGALPHYNPNHARYMDGDVHKFLEHLNDSGHLDNTLLIVMSDHGSRYNWVRNTVQGKLEERLPLMSLRLPPSFQNKHPKLMADLQKNVDRLTTPFDVHETLQTILDISRVETPISPSSRGISLLKEVPTSRTCADAGIPMQWCTCLHYQTLDAGEAGVSEMAQHMIDYMNKKTAHVRQQCTELKLDTILDVQLIHPNEQLLKYSEEKHLLMIKANYFKENIEADVLHYQLTVKTSPNGGIYEGTVRGHGENWTFQIIDDLSRINKYGDQPKCIIKQYPSLRKYCYCKYV